jgi:hypothetical protein
MRYFAVMLLALVAFSCITKERVQYKGVWVKLVEICWEMRLEKGEYEKRYIYVYEPVYERGQPCELSYPLDNSTVIGSKHFMPIKK